METGEENILGISKEKWLKLYLNLQCDHDIMTAFQQLGEPDVDPLSNLSLFGKF